MCVCLAHNDVTSPGRPHAKSTLCRLTLTVSVPAQRRIINSTRPRHSVLQLPPSSPGRIPNLNIFLNLTSFLQRYVLSVLWSAVWTRNKETYRESSFVLLFTQLCFLVYYFAVSFWERLWNLWLFLLTLVSLTRAQLTRSLAFFFFNKNTFLHVFAFICYLLVSTYNRDKVKYFFILLKKNENQKTWKSLMSSCKI